MKLSRGHNGGFTLVEIVVVAGITVFITGILVANFSRSRVDLNQTALVLIDAIREPQALALAGSTFGQKPRCGFGIHFLPNGYLIYAGPNAETTDCSTATRNYNSGGAGGDEIVRQALFSNSLLEINPLPPDIFFEPPDPTTYINGLRPGQTTVIVRRKGANCSGQLTPDCRTINVTTAGLIQAQ